MPLAAFFNSWQWSRVRRLLVAQLLPPACESLPVRLLQLLRELVVQQRQSRLLQML